LWRKRGSNVVPLPFRGKGNRKWKGGKEKGGLSTSIQPYVKR